MDEHRHAEHTASHPHHLHFDSPSMVAYAELEAEVLLGLFTEATAVVATHARRDDVAVRRVLDIGCGPGVGTCCLAQQFEDATVVAADGSAMMLEHAAARAERLGLAHRVEIRQTELPADLGSLGRADVVWASMVLHHVGDEADALGRIRYVLEPGGLLALVEHGDPVRVLPLDVDLGRPGLWERLDAAWGAWFSDMRADLPGATASAAYPAMLEQAGFEVVEDRMLTVVLDPPLDARARRFAHTVATRAQAQLAAHAAPADLAALDPLVDEHGDGSILRRDDAVLVATRHLYVARPWSVVEP